ncbi:SpoIIE family protein phosphatase [Trujillonella humicola]|uniref:SpoIIE family protein phosphatase n=1 Tax=Trujillonella humicola TaxID=3383699 RepID=UPI003905B162
MASQHDPGARRTGAVAPQEPAGSDVRAELADVREEAERASRDADAARAARRAAEASAARMQAMVAGLNAIVWERDPSSWRFRFVNARAEEVLGYPVRQWLDEPGLWQRILHPDDAAAALAAVRTAIADGEDLSLTYRVRAADGRWVWLQHLAHVDRDEAGTATAMHSVLVDVTDSKRRELAAALLAAAGRVLTGPGSVEERLGTVTGLLVPDVADWAAVWLRGDDERYRPVAVAPAGLSGRLGALGSVRVPDEFAAEFRAGRAFAVSEPDEQLFRAATTDEAQFAALTAIGGASWLAAPLTVGGAVVGLLTLTAQTPDRYGDADTAFAADLGQRLATMVAAERLAAQRRQLHEITVALSAAGTAAEAAAALTTGLRDVLGASLVAVCALGDDGQLHTVDVVGAPPGRWDDFTTMRLTPSVPLPDAALTRRPVWLPDRETVAERYPAVVASMSAQTQAIAALPLLVGDRLVGALAVTFRTARPFDGDERAFLLTVADQVAVAFERAALADVRREMAETLQRSLLPGHLPAVDRLAVAARYLPAVSGTSAGGDWYDVLPLPDGAVAVAVGDVVGDGAPAAATMGQLRSALAGILLAGLPPARALEVLDRFSGHVDGARVSTVACLRLEPDAGRLTYSCAGHPPPLLANGGDGTGHHGYLDGGLGPALGLPTSGPRPEAARALPPGATLVLYTDGLVERRGVTLDDGLERLATAVTRRLSAPLPVLLDGVLDDLVDGDGGTDDVAVVAVRLLPAPLRLDLPAEPERLPEVRRAVQRWASAAGLSADAVEDLQLALGEATGNAVEHAYRDGDGPGRVLVELGLDGAGDVVGSVTDAGSWRTPPRNPGFRGRGLQIISTLARDVDLSPGLSGTALRFVLTPAAAPAAARRRRMGVAVLPGMQRVGEQRATLEVTDAQGRRCLALVGDLDLAGTRAIGESVLAELADPRPTTVDLTRLDHVTSVGAGLLLEIAERASSHGDTDILLPATGPARRMLDLTGLATALRSDTGGPPT